MSRDYRIYLEDILQAAGKIRRYAGRKSRTALFRDEKTIDAILRNLEVIGEAAKNVPASVRNAHTGIPWKRMAGLRDILIHAYFSVSADIVWDVVRNKLPSVERKVRSILRGK